jgi:hypothetical protein
MVTDLSLLYRKVLLGGGEYSMQPATPKSRESRQFFGIKIPGPKMSQHLDFCILKSLIGLASSISFNEVELNMIHNLVTTLEPVKLAVEAFCRRDATLLSAETTISFMINNLGNNDLAV